MLKEINFKAQHHRTHSATKPQSCFLLLSKYSVSRVITLICTRVLRAVSLRVLTARSVHDVLRRPQGSERVKVCSSAPSELRLPYPVFGLFVRYTNDSNTH